MVSRAEMVTITLDDINIEADGADLLDWISEHDSDQDEVEFQAYVEKEPPITLDSSFRCTLMVLGLPVVAADKYDKLWNMIRKFFSKEFEKRGCEIQRDYVIDAPMDEFGGSKGVAFFTFASEFEAGVALRLLHGFRLDAQHTLKAIRLDDFDWIISDKNQCQPPMKTCGFTREALRDWWLKGDRIGEQFVVRCGDETEIMWFDPLEREPILVYNGANERAEGRRFSTDQRVEWSPSGSFLAIYRRPGIALHGGNNFELKIRFEHRGVCNISFSPGEEYLLTWDGTREQTAHEKSVCIWRVMTGDLLRSFPTPTMSPKSPGFPHLLWNHNGTLIACLNSVNNSSEVCVYKLPEMVLLSDATGKPATFKYAAEKFDWSPTENILSIVIPGSLDTPARLLLIDVDNRRELSSRNVYNVVNTAMHWQSRGDCFCLRTTISKKTGKKGRKQFNQLEIFRVRERNVPVDTIQIEETFTVKQLHWEESNSKRFALIVKDEEACTFAIRFYRVSDQGATRDTVWITTFDITAQLNHMQWSPAGNYFILGCLGAEGTLFFCTLNDQNKVEVLYKDEHFMMNTIKWSSCGRYLATCVNVPMPSQQDVADSDTFRYSAEAGYCIWTFQGRQLYKTKRENFYSFDFRPHPPSLLKHSDIEAVKRNLKEYSRKYDAMDEAKRNETKRLHLEKRQAELDEFVGHMNKLLAWLRQQPAYPEYEQAWKEFNHPSNWHVQSILFEEVLEVKEQVIE